MTGAYALNWSGAGGSRPWPEQWGRRCDPQGGTREERGGGWAGGRHGPAGHHAAEGHHGPGARHRGGRRGRSGGADFPFEALAAWAFSRGPGGRGHGPEGHGHGPGHHGPTPEQIEALMALRGLRGGGPGGPGFGRGPRGRGRRRRGDVRLAVLRLLAEESRNGYGLMQTIEERSTGQWRPSPGSMYPTLAQLEDEGLIRSAETEGARRFEITDAGREALAERAGEPDPWAPQPDADAHAMSELGPLVLGIGKAVWQVASVGDDDERQRAAQLLAETRRRLYGILAEAPSHEENDEPESDREPTVSERREPGSGFPDRRTAGEPDDSAGPGGSGEPDDSAGPGGSGEPENSAGPEESDL